MNTYNTAERNIQIVLSLLKANGIKRVIASPGSTDIAVVASMQQDPFFEMFSVIDERSAAYMACGMAASTGEPVVIVCTGATSSRNYLPGLTEAYYRHLPVLAITCCRSNANVGHYVNQVTDRSAPPPDTVHVSEYIQTVRSAEDEWDCMIKANRAILGLSFNGGGPCHINLETVYTRDFTVKSVKPARVIRRFSTEDALPPIPEGKIGIFVGCFPKWEKELTAAVDRFCEAYDAVVFHDNTSNYTGKYGVLYPLLAAENGPEFDIDLMIHIGYVAAGVCKGKEMWRVNADGVLRDTFRRTTCIFQMSELAFFTAYADMAGTPKGAARYLDLAREYKELLEKIPELPFSNLHVARTLSPLLPEGSVAHFGICNSLRAWNHFPLPPDVAGYSNTGGFGIDGGISSLVGASLIARDTLHFGFFGDLLFYYDMNALGNRDIGANLRILVVNNGLGQEFRNHSSFGAQFHEDANAFIAAAGHFGNRKTPLIKSFAESLGFEYLSAGDKETLATAAARFTAPDITERPMLLEVFTETEEESRALDMISSLTGKSKVAKGIDALAHSPVLSGLPRKIAKKILR